MGLFMVAAAIAFSPPSARPLPRAATTTELRRSTLFMAEDVPPPVEEADATLPTPAPPAPPARFDLKSAAKEDGKKGALLSLVIQLCSVELQMCLHDQPSDEPIARPTLAVLPAACALLEARGRAKGTHGRRDA